VERQIRQGSLQRPRIPFGMPSWISCRFPHCVQEKPKFGPNAVPGVFLMYVLAPGCVWKGHVMVAALSEFDNVNFAKDDWAKGRENANGQGSFRSQRSGEHRSEYVFPLRKALREGSQGAASAVRCSTQACRWCTVLAVAGSGSPSTAKASGVLIQDAARAEAGGWGRLSRVVANASDDLHARGSHRAVKVLEPAKVGCRLVHQDPVTLDGVIRMLLTRTALCDVSKERGSAIASSGTLPPAAGRQECTLTSGLP
jgi:hypothetical protein